MIRLDLEIQTRLEDLDRVGSEANEELSAGLDFADALDRKIEALLELGSHIRNHVVVYPGFDRLVEIEVARSRNGGRHGR
jgi:hypothetical protein